MSAIITEGSAVGIWKRAIEPEAGTLPPAEARALLHLKLAEADLERADALAAKARAGQLTPQEEHELDKFNGLNGGAPWLSQSGLARRR